MYEVVLDTIATTTLPTSGDGGPNDHPQNTPASCAAGERVANHACTPCAPGESNALDTDSSVYVKLPPPDACLAASGMFELTLLQCIEAAADLFGQELDNPEGDDYGMAVLHGCWVRDDGVYLYNTGGTDVPPQPQCQSWCTSVAGGLTPTKCAAGSCSGCAACAEFPTPPAFQARLCGVGGDDPRLGDTECLATVCGVNEHVVSHNCEACPAGTSNFKGRDDATLGDSRTCVAKAVLLCGRRGARTVERRRLVALGSIETGNVNRWHGAGMC